MLMRGDKIVCMLENATYGDHMRSTFSEYILHEVAS